MVLPEEQRSAPRCEVILPLRILAIGRRTANLLGQTRDISPGGVRFIVPNKVRVGKTIEYVVTRSNCTPPIEIHCVGNVLRCAKKYDDPSYEVVATIERSDLVPGEVEGLTSAADPLRQMLKSFSTLDSDADNSSFWRIPTVDAGRYGPMLRLLSAEDEEMIADPALRRKMPNLRALSEDYSALLAGVRLMMAESDLDRPDLARALVSTAHHSRPHVAGSKFVQVLTLLVSAGRHKRTMLIMKMQA
jgi:hypothetical protein